MKAALLLAAIAATLAGAAQAAHADEYELAMRGGPELGQARLGDTASPATAAVPQAGVALGLSYGLTNQLALDAELAGGTYGAARYDDIAIEIGGTVQPTGSLARTTRYGRAMVGATLRLGVAVIPTIGVAVGVGTRMRGAGAFSNDQVMNLAPDGDTGGTTLDLLASARAGLDYRFGVHWVLGATAGVTHAVPASGPGADSFTGELHVAYYWYP